MKKKLLAAVIMSLAMAAPQVKAEPSALEQALNDPNVEKFLLPSDQSISADLPITSERLFELNDFDTPTGDNYYNIIGNGHSGFGDNSQGVYDLTNVQSISGFNTKASASNPNGDGGAFFLDDDSCLVVLSNNFDADKKPLMTAIANNTAAGKGGAIYANYNWGGGVYLANTNVLENTAGDKGGGLYLDWGINKIVALPGTNVVIADNKAVIGGQLVDNDIYLYSPRKQQNSGGIRGTLSLVTSSTVEDPSSSVPTGTGRIYIGDLRAEGSSDIRIGSSSHENSAIGQVMIENLMLDNDAMFSTQNVSPDSKTSIYIPELTMSRDSIINTVNGYIDDNLHIIDISLDNSNNKFMVDASLMNGNTVIDHFGTISGGTGKLLVNIIGSDTTSGSVRLSSGTTSTATFADSTTQYGGLKYTFTQDPNDKGIFYYTTTKDRSMTLQEALKDINVSVYDMPDLTVADSDLGQLYHFDPEPPYEFVPREFTVNGKGGVLMADGVAERAGISIPQQLNPPEDDNLTPHLIVKDLEAYSGFTRRATDVSAATGGAIWAEDSLLEVDNVLFTNNIATGTADADINTFGMGGAIYIATRDGNYTGQDNFVSKINNSSFINNKTITYGTFGRADDAIYPIYDLDKPVTNKTMGGAALVDGGGAVYSKGNLDVTDSLFANNSAISNMSGYIAEGGALFVTHNSSDGGVNRDVNISGSMFMGNVAGDVLNNGELVNTAAYGGAIFASRVDMNIDDSSFINNTAHAAQITNEYTTVKGEAQGGAIHIDKVATAGPYAYNINNSTFAMNTAEAVKSVDNGDGTYTLTTDGVDQSQAFGGAIAIMRPVETTPKIDVNIDGSDFYVNKAGSGGAIYNKGGLVNIKDSSFRSNTANHYYIDSKAVHTVADLQPEMFAPDEYDSLDFGAMDTVITDADLDALDLDGSIWDQDMTGGAIYNGHTMNIDGSEFSNNYAKQIIGDTAVTVKNDIRNDRYLNFVGKASYLDGGIAGSGYTYFDLDEDQTMTIGANTSIVQTVIGVNSGAVNIVNGDTITARSELFVGEDGLLNIESGEITINSKYNREIENSGTLLNNGTLDISGAQYTASVTNNADATLINGGNIIAKTIINDGSFSNGINPANPNEVVDTAVVTADFTNNANLYNAGIMNGNVNNSGIFLNNGTVNATIANAEGGILANYKSLAGDVTNDGSFANMTGGVITAAVTNNSSGLIANAGNIEAALTNIGTFLNGVNPQNMEETIPNAAITGDVTNIGQMYNAGNLANVSNYGDFTNNGAINGNVTNTYNGNFENNGTINGAVDNSTAEFTNNGKIIGNVKNGVFGDFTNNTNATITGNVENKNDMWNLGSIAGDVTNRGTLTNNGTIDGDVYNDGELLTMLEDVFGTITMGNFGSDLYLLNDGITFDESNKSKIQTSGSTSTKLHLYGDIVSDTTLDYDGRVYLEGGAKLIKGENGDAFQNASKLALQNSTATISTLNGVDDSLDYGNRLDVDSYSTLLMELDWTDKISAKETFVFGDAEISKLDIRNIAEGETSTVIGDSLKSKVNINEIDLITTKGMANSVSYDSATGTLTAARIPNLADLINTSDEAGNENAYYNYAMESNEQGSATSNIIGNIKVSGQGNTLEKVGLTVGDTATDKSGNIILKDANISNVSTTGTNMGAITVQKNSHVSIQAGDHDVTLSGTNGANKNIIYLADEGGATASFEAEEGRTITINDDIRSGNSNNRVFFNGGTIKFNGVLDPLTAVNTGADITRGGVDEDIQWQLFGGTLTYLNDSYLNNSAKPNSIDFAGGTLDLRNGAATTIALQDWTISNDSNIYVDADLAAGKMDKFTSTTTNAGTTSGTSGGVLSVAGINLVSDSNKEQTIINFTDTLMGDVDYTGSTALSRIFKYNVSYDDITGDFEFNRIAGGGYNSYNPGIMASPIAAQLGGYLTQLNSYDQAFMNMDTYMMMPSSVRTALKMRNKMASLENAQYDDTKSMYDYAAGWFRPYATFENVPLHNGPRVSNVMYGSFFGGESPLYDLGHGWDGMWGAYIGYNGSHQAYDGVGIYQNGGTLGLTGMAYKNNFFVGGTVNVGAAGAEASTAFGSDDFAMLMTGAALKTGYNWELADGKFIIQPSLMASYSFVDTFNFRNSAGVAVESDPLHAITIEPGVKFIGNLKNGWQPYAGVSMVFNIMDRTRFQANDVSLPNFSINPFVRYGVGVRKTWGERLTGHFQTYFTNGGRNGVGLSAGFRFAIGKDGSNDVSGKTPELKKTQIKLSSMK